MRTCRSRYLRHRFPAEIISHAVWLYHRYGLSLRDVEDLLAERGVIGSYETIRQWCGKFGPDYTRRLKRRQGRLGDTWFLDEVFVTINGQRQYLWRAVDQDGDLIDILVQPRRDGRAGAEILSQTLEKSATGTVASRDRQAGQLPRRPSGRHALGPPRHDPIREQPCRSLAPTHTTTRASDARLHITCPRAAILTCARRHSESVSRGSTSTRGGESSDAPSTIVQGVGRGDSRLILGSDRLILAWTR